MTNKSDHSGTQAGYIDSYYAHSAAFACPKAMLSGSADADVCVVGGGYTGVSTALHLAERGFKVILLEAQRLGWGASGRNGGHVGIGQRRDQEALENMLGTEHAHALWELSLQATAGVKQLVAKHQIDCDLKNGILHVAAKAAHAAQLRANIAHLNSRYGYDGVCFVERDEVANMLGTACYFGGQLDRDAAHLHPLKYLLGLATAAESAGAVLHEYSRVNTIEDGQQIIVTTDAGQVRARHLVLGCNGYLGSLNKTMAARIMPLNNFIVATEPLNETLARSINRDDLAVADTLFVINYWKLSRDRRLIFGGGENYTRRFPRDIKSFVRKYLLKVYPQLEQTRLDYAWGGTLAITMNRMPSFGRIGNNIYYAQAFCGHGVPIATQAGQLIAESIAGDPKRFDLMASIPGRDFPGGPLLRWPGLVAGMAYHSLLDRIG